MPELIAQIRTKLGKQNRSLRQKGILPAILYRKGKENVNLQLSALDFKKVLAEAGETSVIELKIEGDSETVETKERNVLIHDVARDPLNGDFIHADFYEVRLDEKTTASVPLVFIGESPVVKTEEGTLVKNMTEIEVEALVRDLPRQIEVDISKLQTFDDSIRVKDLKVQGAVKILAEPEETVALVLPPRKEEEVVAPAEEVPIEAEEGAAPAGEEVAPAEKEE
jgi:large subunit ribosomal protein L25